MNYKDLLNIDVKYNIDIDGKYNIDDYFYIKDGKLINPNENENQNNFINLECHRKLKGGNVLKKIIKVLLSVFDPIVKPILSIGEFFIFVLKLLFWLIKFLIWFIQFIFWIIKDLLNPVNLVKDFFHSLMVIIYSIFNAIINIFIAMIQLGINTLGGWMQGFWGWDMSSLSKNDKNSNYFKSFDRHKGQKTYLTNTNTVPFSVILGTILCPPMGVFMDLGITGWLNIVICCLLTLLFYLPGLCYALLIIYS
jgi:uncharacterized membrane protein YqaE (UPF0057 family)